MSPFITFILQIGKLRYTEISQQVQLESEVKCLTFIFIDRERPCSKAVTKVNHSWNSNGF